MSCTVFPINPVSMKTYSAFKNWILKFIEIISLRKETSSKRNMKKSKKIWSNMNCKENDLKVSGIVLSLQNSAFLSTVEISECNLFVAKIKII